MIKYFKFFLICMLFIPFVVKAESDYLEVKSIDELKGDNKILLVVDDNVFTFIDILEEPTSTQVNIGNEISSDDIDQNNIFVIKEEDSSLSGDTLKIKPLVIGDTSVTCSKNASCSKGNLYLKDDMFHYQDKEIKITDLGNGTFSIRSDNSHYLNYSANEWIVSSKEQGIKIFKEVNGVDSDIVDDTINNKLSYITDDILIIGATKLDKEDEVNESYVNIIVHYDLDDKKEYQIKYRYSKYDSVDLKMKFVDKYSDNLFVDKYDYLFNSDEYLDSDYMITRMYVEQDATYSNIKNEDLSIRGGVIDNVSGKSNLHIYVSSKYSAEYYIGEDIQRELTSKNKYYINPDSYDIPSEYANAIDYFDNADILLADSKGLFVYNLDTSGYESSFYLRENDLGLPWYLNGKKISGEFFVSDNAVEAENKVFKFVSYVEVENPNTYSGVLIIILTLAVIAGLVILSRRRLL